MSPLAVAALLSYREYIPRSAFPLIAAGRPPLSLTSSGSVLRLVSVQPGLTASVSHTPLAVYVKSNGIVDDLCDRPPVLYSYRLSKTSLRGR